MVKYDEAAILARLTRLSPRDRAAFALACAKRLDPLLLTVAPSDVVVARQSRELLESTLSIPGSAEPELQAALHRLESLETIDVDAIAAVAYALRAWLTGSPEEAAWAARRAYEAQDLIAQTEN